MNKKDIEAVFPLSHQQKGMFLETLLAPGTGIHIEQSVWAFDGVLDVAHFKQAWQAVMARHAMLRTAFVWKDRPEPLQVTLRSAQMPLEPFDLRGQAPEAQKAFIEAFVRDEGHKGFDLTRAPLMRLALFRTDEAAFQIAWTSHHILMDGWCRQLVLQEVLAGYRALCKGESPQLPPGLSYQGYIAWLKRQDMAQAEQFWRQALQGLAGPTLPGRIGAGGGEGEADAPFEPAYAVQRLCLSTADTQALAALGQKQRVTLNTLLQGMWALLLSRYSGDEDVIFGTTVSGRPADLPGSEHIVGLFITTLPFRVRAAAAEPLWPWLRALQAQHLQLRSYEHCSEGQIHPWSGLPGGQPLFESILVFENYPRALAAAQASPAPGAPQAAGGVEPDAGAAGAMRFETSAGARTKYALALLAIPGAALELQLIVDQRRFVPGSVPAILEHCAALLERFLGDEATCLADALAAVPDGQAPVLRGRGAAQAKAGQAFEAPRTQTEKTLANMFSKLLDVDQMGRDENFFGVGGHSLMALQLVNRVQETFQVDLPLQASFEAPTIAELARRIEQAQEAAGLPVIAPLAKDEERPLSAAQQAIWDLLEAPVADTAPPNTGFLRGLFAARPGRKPAVDAGSPWRQVHALVAGIHLDGPLDRSALEESLKRLSQRHEALRTRFVLRDGRVLQEIGGDEPAVSLRVLPLPGASWDDASVRSLVERERKATFDAGQGNLWRVTLVGLANEPPRHLLLLTLHPLIADGPSARLLARDLAGLYAAVLSGGPDALPELSVHFADYAAWQCERLGADGLQKQLDFWQQTLGGYRVLFPVTRSRNGGGARLLLAAGPDFVLAKPLVDALKALSQHQSLPWHLALAGAFQALLYRCTNEADLAVALPVPHRPYPNTLDVVGPFGNYLALRTFFSDETRFLDVLQQLRQAFAGGFGNQDAPFESVARQISPSRVQVLFAVEDEEDTGLGTAAGLAFCGFRLAGSEQNFELCLTMRPAPGASLAGSIRYNPHLFDAATIDRFTRDYQALLTGILDAPASPIAALALGTVPVG
ncbi:MAG: condensation domain-containing protein [Chloroflexota bacterium]